MNFISSQRIELPFESSIDLYLNNFILHFICSKFNPLNRLRSVKYRAVSSEVGNTSLR